MGNIVFFVDLKAINRGKDDKRGDVSKLRHISFFYI